MQQKDVELSIFKKEWIYVIAKYNVILIDDLLNSLESLAYN